RYYILYFEILIEDTMVKNFILCLISLIFFVSCGNEVNSANDENNVKNDQDISETDDLDDDSLIDEENCRQADGGISNFAKVTYEEDKCANPGERTFRMLHLVEPVDHPTVNPEFPEMTCSMIIDKIEGGEINNFTSNMEESLFYVAIEKQKYTDISGVAEGIKCWNADRYTIRFNGYDRDLFNESMIGKKILFYTIWDYSGQSKVNVVTMEDGTWIAVNGFANNEEGLKPEINVYKSSMLQCETLCVYGTGYNDENIPNYTIQPPVQFDVEDLDEVVLIRNGESQIIGDYEFYADFSVAISSKDPDGIFTVEADYDPLPPQNGQFYFSVINIGALK
ncbi:MAG TPA: hypothetical protein VLJ60_10245, partial [bacterium]|nr:hypothetical protein [bacterium]